MNEATTGMNEGTPEGTPEATAEATAEAKGREGNLAAVPPAVLSASPSVGAPAPLRGLAAVRRVFSVCAIDPLRRKRGWVLFALTMLPVILILVAILFGAERGGGGLFFTGLTSVMYHYIEVLVFLFLGCFVLGNDMENRAMTFDLVCPVSRLSLFAGRYLTYVLSALLLVLPALVILYTVCLSRYGMDSFLRSLPLLGAVLLGAVIASLVYGSFFIFLSVITKRAVLWSVLLVIVFSGFLANLPFRISMMAPLFHLRNIMASVSEDSGFFPMKEQLGHVNLEMSALASAGVLFLLWILWTGAGALFFNRKQFP
jgi:hypothetical protein